METRIQCTRVCLKNIHFLKKVIQGILEAPSEVKTFHGACGISDFQRNQQNLIIIKSKSICTFKWFIIIVTITIIISTTMSQSMAIKTNKIDAPRCFSYGVYISQLIHFTRLCCNADGFKKRNKGVRALRGYFGPPMRPKN